METRQIRINPETPRAAGNLRRSIHLVAPVIAATMWLGTHPAFAETVSPRGDAFTATSTSVTFVVDPVTVTCTSSSTSGTLPATGVCAPITTPTFSGCTTNVNTNATVLATGSWMLCVGYTGIHPTGTLMIPQRGVSAAVNILGGTCTTTAAPDGPAVATGRFINGRAAVPTANPPSTIAFTSVDVPISGGGAAGCPMSPTGTFTATYTIKDTTNPAAAIMVGP
jgi:hypothetical protein